MQPRHALQSAALQFGRDGTDRSLAEMRAALAMFDVPAEREPAGRCTQPGCDLCEAERSLANLAGETFLTARLDGESHSE